MAVCRHNQRADSRLYGDGKLGSISARMYKWHETHPTSLLFHNERPVFYFTMSVIGQLDHTRDAHEVSTRAFRLIQIHPDNPALSEHDQEAPYRYIDWNSSEVSFELWRLSRLRINPGKTMPRVIFPVDEMRCHRSMLFRLSKCSPFRNLVRWQTRSCLQPAAKIEKRNQGCNLPNFLFAPAGVPQQINFLFVYEARIFCQFARISQQRSGLGVQFVFRPGGCKILI